jgi:SAM-dependent methyltransferase
MISSLVRRVRGRYRVWQDAALDRKYGIQTGGFMIDVGPIGVPGETARHGNPYEPIQLEVFRRIMAALPICPSTFTFVDFGSGKGRALVLAAEYGFRRVIGIEHATRLHEAAKRNVARFQLLSGTRIPIALHRADASEFWLPAEDLVCFFYNPFDEVLMGKVLGNIRASLEAAPRRLFLVYRNPRHGEKLTTCEFLRCLVRNSTFELHQNTASPS